MTMQDCAICGDPYDASMLLFHAKGRICESCELELQDRESTSRGIWMTVLGGPITAMAGSVMPCVPFAGPYLTLGFGAMALWRGSVALQVVWLAHEDERFEPVHKVFLGLSGALTLAWSILLVIAGGALAAADLYRMFLS